MSLRCCQNINHVNRVCRIMQYALGVFFGKMYGHCTRVREYENNQIWIFHLIKFYTIIKNQNEFRNSTTLKLLPFFTAIFRNAPDHKMNLSNSASQRITLLLKRTNTANLRKRHFKYDITSLF